MMRKEAAGSPGGTEVALDSADCLTLQQILKAFNSNISEEHAWALFYQASRCYQKCLDEGTAYYLPTELRHVLLHKDGTVHPSTLLHTGGECFFFNTQLFRINQQTEQEKYVPAYQCESEVAINSVMI